jgi:hypothetical protein
MANRYNTPDQGTVDWHVPLNENFSALDRDVEVRDAESNLGDHTPRAGSKFLATDTGAVYVGDGANWRRLGSIPNRRTFTTQMTKYGGGLAEYELFRLPGDGVTFALKAVSAATLGGGTADRSAVVRVYAGSTETDPVATIAANEAQYEVDAAFAAGDDLVVTLDTSEASADVTLNMSAEYEIR